MVFDAFLWQVDRFTSIQKRNKSLVNFSNRPILKYISQPNVYNFRVFAPKQSGIRQLSQQMLFCFATYILGLLVVWLLALLVTDSWCNRPVGSYRYIRDHTSTLRITSDGRAKCWCLITLSISMSIVTRGVSFVFCVRQSTWTTCLAQKLAQNRFPCNSTAFLLFKGHS